MTKIKKRLISISLIIVLMLSLAGCEFISRQNNARREIIFIQYYSDGKSEFTNNIDDVPRGYFDNSGITVQIVLNYESVSEELHRDQGVNGETYVEFSKRYHTEKNQAFLNEIDTEGLNVTMSSYTPCIFINYPVNTDLDEVYEYAEKISGNESIGNIRISAATLNENDSNS